MSSLNNIFIEYSKIIEKVDSTFNVEKSFFNKILEIVAVIQHGNNANFNGVNNAGSGSTVSGGGKKEEHSLFSNNNNKGKN